MKYGMDYIGGVNYIDVICRHHPKKFAAGFLCRASGWGNGIAAARALAESGRCEVMRIHGLWDDNHYFTERDIKRAERQAKKVARLKEDYPEITIFYSPWLEHRAPEYLFKACKEACRRRLPKEVKIISSGAYSRGIREVHHSPPVSDPYFFSYDGADIFKDDVGETKRVHGRAIHFYGWTPSYNGKRYLNDNTPRQDRKHWPTGQDIRAMRRLMRRS